MSRDERLKRDIEKAKSKVQEERKAKKDAEAILKFLDNLGGDRHPSCAVRIFCEAKPETCKHCKSHWKNEGEKYDRNV